MAVPLITFTMLLTVKVIFGAVPLMLVITVPAGIPLASTIVPLPAPPLGAAFTVKELSPPAGVLEVI